MASKNKPETVQPQPEEIVADQSDSGEELVVIDDILPSKLFVVPAPNTALYPGMVVPMSFNSQRAAEAVKQAENVHNLIGFAPLKEAIPESQDADAVRWDFHDSGVVGRVVRQMNLPDGGLNILLNSLKRFRIKRWASRDPLPVAEVEYLEDIAEEDDEEVKPLMRVVINTVKEISDENPLFTEEIKLVMVNLDSPGRLSDVVASVLQLPMDQYLFMLRTLDVKRRLEKLVEHLKTEKSMTELQRRIQEQIQQRVQGQQREYMLREQMKAIQKELGGEEKSEAELYKEKIEAAKLPEAALKAANEELRKLELLSESSPDYAVSRNYLDWITSLPWSKTTEERLDIKAAKKILDADHYGIAEVKERILEFLAVRKRKGQAATSILCLVGPPGVGKTSLGRSIARSMNRKFIRFSVGGMRDEAEIKGHRRTYIGAMPGKILQELKRAESRNPVFLLDEIDKLSHGMHGDPASALLETLDPEQNATFLDHYIDVPFDLSQVMFLCTANTLDTIPGPLLDRMEVIRLPGYIVEEKLAIGTRYILPRQRDRHGLQAKELNLSNAVLRKVITAYTREAGLRNFEREVAKICRKAATKLTMGGKPPVRVTVDNLADFLGQPRLKPEVANSFAHPGIVTGLAWTPVGGDILFIEAILVPERGSNMRLTGQLGDVMKESANIAFSFVRSRMADWDVDPDFFAKNQIHLHVPAGAVPKDGPSAGLAMATAMLSLLTGKKVDTKLAMTGEITLSGKALPVGGIKEKVIAAHRAGIKKVILPADNEQSLEDIPAKIRKGLKFHLVTCAEEVFDIAFVKGKKKAGKKKRKGC